ncbi:MAG: hypothetical protein ACREO0_05500 [Pseudoxanthomonas sp.]
MSAATGVLDIGVPAAVANCAHYLREELGLVDAAEQMDAVLATVEQMAKALQAASHVLRSYQYGNSATELAGSTADNVDAVLADFRGAE